MLQPICDLIRGTTKTVRDDFKTHPLGFVRFWVVAFVINNDNRTEPDGTTGQPPVEFLSRPYANLPSVPRGHEHW